MTQVLQSLQRMQNPPIHIQAWWDTAVKKDKAKTSSHIHLQWIREGLKIQPQWKCGSFVCFAKALYVPTICMHNEHAIAPTTINIWQCPKHVLNSVFFIILYIEVNGILRIIWFCKIILNNWSDIHTDRPLTGLNMVTRKSQKGLNEESFRGWNSQNSHHGRLTGVIYQWSPWLVWHFPSDIHFTS